MGCAKALNADQPTIPLFEVVAPKCAWLDSIVSVAPGHRLP
jgi:hypothetical protein